MDRGTCRKTSESEPIISTSLPNNIPGISSSCRFCLDLHCLRSVVLVRTDLTFRYFFHFFGRSNQSPGPSTTSSWSHSSLTPQTPSFTYASTLTERVILFSSLTKVVSMLVMSTPKPFGSISVLPLLSHLETSGLRPSSNMYQKRRKKSWLTSSSVSTQFMLTSTSLISKLTL